ncbi:MAG: DUF4442 domain-containing protein [Bdellovibrionales bacterium]|jgi:hypothetical protein|nr:DUF4442 domain-containing protein [Bdellovibrionales bacterium]
MNWKAKLIRFWNIWPPFVGAGISIVKTEGAWAGVGGKSAGIRSLMVRLKHRFWNSNYVGTQFGGSLFAMTDPFLMVILVQRLGRDYVVWDKASTIRFRRPGLSNCYARFEVTDEELRAIQDEVRSSGKMDLIRKIEITDEDGAVVAEVEKTIYIATKAYYKQSRLEKSSASTGTSA